VFDGQSIFEDGSQEAEAKGLRDVGLLLVVQICLVVLGHETNNFFVL